ncbi:hypothetical protein C8R44DRAFT_987545 [Mycena epipterygia]|nr:hypothetical protein C8R44DRAFT_987545 [Mycena epipterygia]
MDFTNYWSYIPWVYFDISPCPTPLAIAACSLIFLHHSTIIVFGWRVHRLAIIDLAIVGIETCVLCDVLYQIASQQYFIFSVSGPFVCILTIQMVLLLLSAAFRTATALACNDKLVNQRFAFLGGCARTRPPYTPLAILLNRRLLRPLVRAESSLIIFVRVLVLACIGVGVPSFAIYTIIITPFNGAEAQVYTKSLVNIDETEIPGNTTLLLSYSAVNSSSPSSGPQPSVFTNLSSGGTRTCFVSDEETWLCPTPWTDISSIFISIASSRGILGAVSFCPISFTFPGGSDWDWEYACSDGSTNTSPGSHLVGSVRWTEQRIITKFFWGFPRATVFTAEIVGLHPQVSNDTLNSDLTTLTLYPNSFATKLLEETVDLSVLSGIATFGGFWTFLNGAFALFFGANVIYFAFGRRPLSALGVVHIFQRRALVRQWNEDFPAIHTEGGQPGSESAGIVAFIRQRLVDLGEDPRSTADGHETDLEAQTQEPGSEPDTIEVHGAYSVQESGGEDDTTEIQINGSHSEVKFHRGYFLEEIPLLDMDLGLGGCNKE